MPYIKYSGAPKMMSWVANAMCADHDVTVCTFFDSEVTQIMDQRIKTDCLKIKRNKNRFLRLSADYFTTVQKIKKYVKMSKPDAVISFGDVFSLLFIGFFRGRNYKVILSERADPSQGKRLFVSFRKFLFGRADRIVCQTDGAMQLFPESVRKKAVVIPNPIDKLEGLTVDPKSRSKDIISVGRFELKQKRQDILVKAFEKICDDYPEFSLKFYGDGADLDTVKEMASRTKCSDRIHFMGAVFPIIEHISSAYLMALTSDYEGIPNSVIEAMSVECPVLATDCSPGGARLLLEDGKYGYLAERGNVESVEKGLRQIIENYQEACNIAASAKESLSRFDSQVIADKWAVVITSF